MKTPVAPTTPATVSTGAKRAASASRSRRPGSSSRRGSASRSRPAQSVVSVSDSSSEPVETITSPPPPTPASLSIPTSINSSSLRARSTGRSRSRAARESRSRSRGRRTTTRNEESSSDTSTTTTSPPPPPPSATPPPPPITSFKPEITPVPSTASTSSTTSSTPAPRFNAAGCPVSPKTLGDQLPSIPEELPGILPSIFPPSVLSAVGKAPIPGASLALFPTNHLLLLALLHEAALGKITSVPLAPWQPNGTAWTTTLQGSKVVIALSSSAGAVVNIWPKLKASFTVTDDPTARRGLTVVGLAPPNHPPTYVVPTSLLPGVTTLHRRLTSVTVSNLSSAPHRAMYRPSVDADALRAIPAAFVARSVALPHAYIWRHRGPGPIPPELQAEDALEMASWAAALVASHSSEWYGLIPSVPGNQFAYQDNHETIASLTDGICGIDDLTSSVSGWSQVSTLTRPHLAIVRGHPGTYKSTWIAGLTQELDIGPRIAAMHFFKRGSKETAHDESVFFNSLVRQLFAFIAAHTTISLPQTFIKLLVETSSLSKRLSILFETLTQLTKASLVPRCYILIDALDATLPMAPTSSAANGSVVSRALAGSITTIPPWLWIVATTRMVDHRFTWTKRPYFFTCRTYTSGNLKNTINMRLNRSAKVAIVGQLPVAVKTAIAAVEGFVVGSWGLAMAVLSAYRNEDGSYDYTTITQALRTTSPDAKVPPLLIPYYETMVKSIWPTEADFKPLVPFLSVLTACASGGSDANQAFLAGAVAQYSPVKMDLPTLERELSRLDGILVAKTGEFRNRWFHKGFALYLQERGYLDKIKLDPTLGHVIMAKYILNATTPLSGYAKRFAIMHAGKSKDPAIVKKMVGRLASGINSADSSGMTMLRFAAQEGDLPVVQALVKAKATVATTTITTSAEAITLAAGKGHLSVVKWLREEAKCVIKVSRSDPGYDPPLLRAARHGQVEVVKYLLETGDPADAIQKRSDGRDALMIAIEGKHAETAKVILECPKFKFDPSTSLKSSKYATYLYKACDTGDESVFQLLISHPAVVRHLSKESSFNFNYHTPLWALANQGHDKLIRPLLESTSTALKMLEVKNDLQWAPDFVATAAGRFEALKVLAEFLDKKKMSVLDAQSRSIVGVAVEFSGGPELVSWLVKHLPFPAVVDAPGNRGQTPLYKAITQGKDDIAKILLEEGKSQAATLRTKDTHPMTPLVKAIEAGVEGRVRMLLKDGRSDSLLGELWTSSKYNVFYLAASKGNTSCLNALWERRSAVPDVIKFLATPNSSGISPFGVACQYGRIATVKWCLHPERLQHIKIDEPEGKDLITPLWAAVNGQKLDVARALLAVSNKSVDTPNKTGKTPLYVAVTKSNTEMVNVLLTIGGVKALDAPDADGNTPLALACSKGRADMVRTFLDAGATGLSRKNKAGRTPLHLACASGQSSAISLLVDKVDKELLYAKDNHGDTPLILTAFQSTDEPTRTILRAVEKEKRSSYLREGNVHGHTALHKACARGNLKTITLLVEQGVDCLYMQDEDGQTPLWAVAGTSNSGSTGTKIIELMANHGGRDVFDFPDINGATPLWAACRRGSSTIALGLLRMGANPWIAANDGTTPLHAAMIGSNWTLVTTMLPLLPIKIFEAPDNLGNTPLSIAKVRGQTCYNRMAAMLERDRMRQRGMDELVDTTL